MSMGKMNLDIDQTVDEEEENDQSLKNVNLETLMNRHSPQSYGFKDIINHENILRTE